MVDAKPVALLLNDIHVGKDTIEDFKLNWKEALDIVLDNDIRKIFVGGDMFLNRSSQTLDILLAVHDALDDARRCGIDVIMLEGNHDLVDQESERGYCHVFDSFNNVAVVDSYETFELSKELTLSLISYFPEDGTFTRRHDELVKEINKRYPDHKNYLYIHQGIAGALFYPSETDLPVELFKLWGKVMVGHYHNRCKFENIEYIGSSRQHNFGEDEEKGYTLLYSDGSTLFIMNGVNMRYVTLNVGFEDANQHLVGEIEDLRDDNYKVKLKISCKPEQLKSVNKQVFIDAGASKVEIVQDSSLDLEASQESFEKRYDKSGLKEIYKSFCNDNGYNDTDIDLGIKYLNVIS